MSILSAKIDSYNPKFNTELNQAYTTSPTNTGSFPQIGAWSTAGTGNPTDPVWISSGGPQNGAGYWKFAQQNRYRNSIQSPNQFYDNYAADLYRYRDYVMGVWVRFPVLPVMPNFNAKSIMFILPRGSGTPYNGNTGFNLQLSGTVYDAVNNQNPNRLHFAGQGAQNNFIPVGPTIEANRWYYVAVARKFTNGMDIPHTDNTKLYLDGQLLLTQTIDNLNYDFNTIALGGAAGPGVDYVQDTHYANFHVGSNANFTPAALLDIYQTAYPAPTNINVNAIPLTATSLQVDPLTLVSHNATPLTATLLQVDPLIVSASAVLSQTSLTASLTSVDPTVIATNPNTTQIFTSVTVSALMVEPFSIVVSTNNSIAADVMTASITATDHVIVISQNVLYFADEATASAISVNPYFYGNPNKIILATPLLVSTSIFVDPNIQLEGTYDALVLQSQPIFFINDGNKNSPQTVNKGSGNFGNVYFESGVQVVASGNPMQMNGEGTSWRVVQDDFNSEISLNSANAITAMKNMHSNGSFTYEWWWKPETNYYQYPWMYNGYFLFTMSGDTGSEYNPDLYTTVQVELNNNTPDMDLFSTGIRYNPNRPYSTANPTTYPVDNNLNWFRFPTLNVWHHMAITGSYANNSMQVKVYVDGNVVQQKTVNNFTISQGAIDGIHALRINKDHGAPTYAFDQFAIYDHALSAVEVLDHYSFVLANSGDRNVGVSSMTAEVNSGDNQFFVVTNLNYPEIPVTASANIVNPSISTSRTINFTATPITATLNIVQATVQTVRQKNIQSDVFVASVVSPGGFTSSVQFYNYVTSLSPAPYRYHNLDNPTEWTQSSIISNANAGTDTVYGFNMLASGDGNHTQTTGVINNYSILSELDYNQNNFPKSLIVYESVYNDDWGTVFNNVGDGWTTSFCVRSHPDHPVNEGVVVLASAKSHVRNDNILLYHKNNKLSIELKQDNTTVSYESASNVNIFNNLRHQITITLHKTGGNSHQLNVYVDGVSVISQNVGNVVPELIQSTTVQGPNTTNWEKFALGGLLSVKSNYLYFTENNGNPPYSKLYFDEFIWFKYDMTSQQVLALYNNLPLQLDINHQAGIATASALIVMPTLELGTSKTTTSLQAINCTLVSPNIYYDKTVFSDINLIATALIVNPVVRLFKDNNVIADPMQATCLFNNATFRFSISGGPMIATVKAVNSTPYFDPYNLLIMTQAHNTSSSMTTYGGRWGIGDH